MAAAAAAAAAEARAAGADADDAYDNDDDDDEHLQLPSDNDEASAASSESDGDDAVAVEAAGKCLLYDDQPAGPLVRHVGRACGCEGGEVAGQGLRSRFCVLSCTNELSFGCSCPAAMSSAANTVHAMHCTGYSCLGSARQSNACCNRGKAKSIISVACLPTCCACIAWLQNPYLPGCWYSRGLAPTHQVIKPHQLSGLRFMWDCLVREHHDSSSASDDPAAAHNNTAPAAAGSDDDDDFVGPPAAAAAGRGKGKKQRKKRGARAADDDAAGGCILAHSMGLGKSFQTVALLWLYFQQL
jgi:hypothetical protein